MDAQANDNAKPEEKKTSTPPKSTSISEAAGKDAENKPQAAPTTSQRGSTNASLPDSNSLCKCGNPDCVGSKRLVDPTDLDEQQREAFKSSFPGIHEVLAIMQMIERHAKRIRAQAEPAILANDNVENRYEVDEETHLVNENINYV